MSTRGRRVFRRNLNIVVSLVILSITYTLLSQNVDSIKKFFTLPRAQVQFAQEAPKVVQQKPTTPQIVLQKSAVLAAKAAKGTCGQAWKWPCDDSLKVGGLVNGKLIGQAGNTIYFENVLFKKEPPGLEIPANASAKVSQTDNNGTPKDKTDDIKYEWGVCLTNGEEFNSLAMISLSQPLLPKTIQGLNLSIKPVNAEKKEYAEIDLDWLSTLKPEQFEAMFCSLAGTYSEYTLRSMDIYGIIPSSNQFGADWASYIGAKCNGRAPGQTKAEFVKDWKDDKAVDTTTFKVLIENNEAHNEVKEKFRKKMLKDGFSGIIEPGAPYLGGLAFQPKAQDSYAVRLSGSTASSKFLANMLNTSPQLGTEDLMKNEKIDNKPAGEDSKTVLSIDGSKLQDEFEKATVESAIFGGIFYIPDSEVEKGGNPSMLSYVPSKLDPSRYLCDEQSGNSSCPVVKAVTGCSGIATAKVSVRLRQIVLSAVNDTDRYAGTTGSNSTTVARSYTRAGDFFQGQYREPQGSIKRATVDELVVLTGKGTAACTAYAAQRVSQQPETKVSDADIENIQRMAEEPNYNMQQILVSPINVKYRTWALYKRDPTVLGLINAIFPGLVRALFGPDPEWAADEVDGEVIRPALISFKADTLFRGLGGTAVGSSSSVDVQKDITAYLDRIKIKPMTDSHIDCGLGPYGDPEYWLCSDSKNILPKCL